MTVEQLTKATAALKIQPLKRNFSLDALYPSFKVQPHIGTEFKRGIQIRDLLKAPNADELFLDLAVLIAERNVVFFRDQDLNFEEQKEFVDRLGKISGKPATSGLHSHPISEESDEFGEKNYEVSSVKNKTLEQGRRDRSEFHSRGFHSDVTFEVVPPDYTALRLRELPPEGGDTLWASSYEAYDRLSPAFAKFVEGLTAFHSGDGFIALEKAGLVKINAGPRGSPEDVGTHLSTSHPVVRTNPITGWKGLYVSSGFTKRINELSKDESDVVLQHLFNLYFQNHDLQVRFKWGKHDVAVWDNRSALHAATADFDADAFIRVGERAASLGEKPYLDPNSTSRRVALGLAPPTARRAHLASLAAEGKK
ncbi:taurine catabolism dioxygenase [Rhizoclosmatium globosum]|uniref:Taurine catabolism dioxygenase n=1 Tax=Rhizoclosmatium globosum TaxID=329046 RepID=A0A1Y2BQS2_9FUNG|nr:taurine catabolism dioxygenase [Rhizoclosmatium globosum]|eukprot:ORY37096.1 taurine catabolism dioxygenase [Rhizoclosmatium globosum]